MGEWLAGCNLQSHHKRKLAIKYIGLLDRVRIYPAC
jgi:hypothetical protein